MGGLRLLRLSDYVPCSASRRRRSDANAPGTGLGYSRPDRGATRVVQSNRSRHTAMAAAPAQTISPERAASPRHVGHVAGLRHRPGPARSVRPGARRPHLRALERQDPPLSDHAAARRAGRGSRRRSRPHVQPAFFRLRPEEARRGALPLHPRQSRRDLRLLPALHGTRRHRRPQDLSGGRARLLQPERRQPVAPRHRRARPHRHRRDEPRVCPTSMASRPGFTPAKWTS